jgi:probable rRNA maturation factor
MGIDIFTEETSLPYAGISRRKLKAWLSRICAAESLGDSPVALILTGNEYIKKINKKYRGKNRPTDVISFAYREAPIPGVGGPEPLGDIYLSLEKAAEQAERYGVSMEEEVKRLLVHGVLHLSGYDHERSKKDALAMKTREEEILGAL